MQVRSRLRAAAGASVQVREAQQRRPPTSVFGVPDMPRSTCDAAVMDGMTYTLVIDYNAGQSIKQTGQGLLMTPVIAVKSFTGVPTPGTGSGSASGSGSAG